MNIQTEKWEPCDTVDMERNHRYWAVRRRHCTFCRFCQLTLLLQDAVCVKTMRTWAGAAAFGILSFLVMSFSQEIGIFSQVVQSTLHLGADLIWKKVRLASGCCVSLLGIRCLVNRSLLACASSARYIDIDALALTLLRLLLQLAPCMNHT